MKNRRRFVKKRPYQINPLSGGQVEDEDATRLVTGHYPRLAHEQEKTFSLGVITVKLTAKARKGVILVKLRR